MRRPKLGQMRESIRVVRSIARPTGLADTENVVQTILTARAKVRQTKPEELEDGGSAETPDATFYEFTFRLGTRSGSLPIQKNHTLQWRNGSYRIIRILSDFFSGFVKVLCTLDAGTIIHPPQLFIAMALEKDLSVLAANSSGAVLLLERPV